MLLLNFTLAKYIAYSLSSSGCVHAIQS